MTNPTKEQIAKLPKWAQDYIRNLQREREIAVRELNEWVDSQTPAPFRIIELVCTGEDTGPTDKTRYVQGNRIEAVHANISLEVSVFRDGEIGLTWSTEGTASRDVAWLPSSSNSARLVTKENMK